MLFTLATLACFAPQGPGISAAPVCINEVVYDDASTDDQEFVELYNRQGAPVDISGWKIVGYDGTATGNGDFTFPGAAGSMTTVINPGDYLLLSLPGVPNHNPLFVMPSTMMENGADGVTLEDDLGNVIDSFVWEFQAWTNPVPTWLEGDGFGGGVYLNELNPAANAHSAQRWLDGYDDNDNGLDFVLMVATPGASNGSLNTLAPPVVDNFDGGVGTTSTWGTFSFVAPIAQDPAAITNATGSSWSIPPSPQGGNVATFHDATGGGNMVTTMTFPATDYLVETYIYLEADTGFAAADGEAWAIGIGSTDSYGQPADVTGTYQTTITCNIGNGAGITGLAWMGYNTAGQVNLYLVDFGNGGPGWTVLGGPITVTPGVDDGWQRLRLRVNGSDVVGNFGGNYGRDDGTRITATVPVRKYGQVYFQYRECVAVNAMMNPLTLDRLEIYPAVGSNVLVAGTASPTTFALPAIGTSGSPTVGSANFAFTATGMIPTGISIIVLDTNPLLPGIPIPGMPATVLAYVGATALGTVFNSPAGTATAALPIPAANVFAGATISGQFYDLDPALGTALPFGSSEGCQVTIGN